MPMISEIIPEPKRISNYKSVHDKNLPSWLLDSLTHEVMRQASVYIVRHFSPKLVCPRTQTSCGCLDIEQTKISPFFCRLVIGLTIQRQKSGEKKISFGAKNSLIHLQDKRFYRLHYLFPTQNRKKLPTIFYLIVKIRFVRTGSACLSKTSLKSCTAIFNRHTILLCSCFIQKLFL